MSTRIYVEITSIIGGAPLFIREQIQALQPDIKWLYDDALNILEMTEYRKWPDAETELQSLFSKNPDLKLEYWIEPEKDI